MGQGFLRRGRRVVVAEVVTENRVETEEGPDGGDSAPPVVPKVPRAIYRFQLTPQFGLREVRALVPYLASLGFSHVCCSPYLRALGGTGARLGLSGEDAVDPLLGDHDSLEALALSLQSHGMGQIIEVAPDQMTDAGNEHVWWLDVLENGAASRFADHFDLEWDAGSASGPPRVVVVLPESAFVPGASVPDIPLVFDESAGCFFFVHDSYRLPLSPASYGEILRTAAGSVEASLPEAGRELHGIAAGFDGLPSCDTRSAAEIAARGRGKERLKHSLAGACERWPEIVAGIEAVVATLNGEHAATDGRSRGLLLDRQAFRAVRPSEREDLAKGAGRAARRELRIEHEAVFHATHRPVLDWARKGWVQGVRVDCLDRLRDPVSYLGRLSSSVSTALAHGEGSESVSRSGGPSLYVVVDKVTSPEERLPASWPIDGTTGLQFANAVDGVFVDTAAKGRFDRIYTGFTGKGAGFWETARACKLRALESAHADELDYAARRLSRISGHARDGGDDDPARLRAALAEVIASLPVYRIYSSSDSDPQTRAFVDRAIESARASRPDLSEESLALIRRILLGDGSPDGDGLTQDERRAVTLRLQRLAAAAMTLGVEERALYRHVGLVSLNETGGDPSTFGTTLPGFHGANRERSTQWPRAVVPASTQAACRSTDARARINVLSEIPGAWRDALERWADMNARFRVRLTDDRTVPAAADEYMLYQTLLGTWPLAPLDAEGLRDYASRIRRYMIRAARAAGVQTSHEQVDADYEEALGTFVDGILASAADNAFLQDFAGFREYIAWLGILNSLSNTALKLTVPGVPQMFQGAEFFDFTLDREDREERAQSPDWENRKILSKRL
ncbi:MAG: malto-oligosyltrehalose synthase, partial [Betaproteobacteria bacterium]|nr:malto-oligosyltrehalose synthase [Betaproteobacteria bacterium]